MMQEEQNLKDVETQYIASQKTISRREVKRYKYEGIKIMLECIKENVNLEGKIINISEKGMLAVFDEEISVPQRVNIRFVDDFVNVETPNLGVSTLNENRNPKGLPYNLEQIKARVMWCYEDENKKYKYGINFIEDQNIFKTILENEKENNLTCEDRREIQRRKSETELSNDKLSDNNKRKNERRIDKPVFLKCARLNKFKNFIKNNEYFYHREFQSATGNSIVRNGKKMLMFGSNNYFGLANHPEVVEALIKTAEKYGAGSGGSRILCGTMDLHNQLEKDLADFIGGEDCIVYSMGYGANLGLISALLDKKGYLIIDENAHASIIDGALLGGANIIVYKHNNMKSLEDKLRKLDKDSYKIIATEGIFSMDGDICPLDKVHELSEKYQSALLLDEAHATGILGENGRGTAEYFGLTGKIDLTVGTMSKALGCIGGFVVGNKDIIHFLKHVSKPFLFTTSLPPSVTAGIIKALELIKKDSSFRERLWKNISYVKKELIKLKFDIGQTNSSIIPVIVKEDKIAHVFVKMLEEKGIFVSPVIYPAVKKGEARLRVSIMTTHTKGDLDFLLQELKSIGNKLGICHLD
jgi:8-amino-7-oxononanoate synthase